MVAPTTAELQAKLDALQAEMQDFTYTVSHDLRAPLRHIVSYAELVREDAGPQLAPEVQGFLDTICNSAHAMGQMLDRLLELSRVGTAILHWDALPVQPLVQKIVAEIAQGVQSAQPHRTVVWELAADLPAVYGDVLLLSQALRHVLVNAVQFTSTQAPAVIGISATSDITTGTVTMHIKDNGIGFPAAMGDRLFRPFSRLHNARQGAGLGTGLALTRKAMDRMNGTVTAQGVVDGGCTVHLTLQAA